MTDWPDTGAALLAKPTTGGRRIYAIGDVHGRADLLASMIKRIATDAGKAASAERPMIVFLGDYIDRGPESRQVIDLILGARAAGAAEVRALKGNHEQSLLRFLDDPKFGAMWVSHGGAATLMSYGVRPPPAGAAWSGWEAARDALREALAPAHLGFYQSLELMVQVGDYAFAHAGVRPGITLAAQSEQDLLWIRREFLDARTPFEKVIVHGHSPMADPQRLEHRIGIDTGAYAIGVLTAVCLHHEEQRIIQVGGR